MKSFAQWNRTQCSYIPILEWGSFANVSKETNRELEPISNVCSWSVVIQHSPLSSRRAQDTGVSGGVGRWLGPAVWSGFAYRPYLPARSSASAARGGPVAAAAADAVVVCLSALSLDEWRQSVWLICNLTLPVEAMIEGFDLTLTSGSILMLTYTKKKKLNHLTRLDERITILSEFWLCCHFWRCYEPKIKTRLLGHWHGIWGHRLTWNLKFGYRSLRLITADTLAFSGSSSLIRGETAREIVLSPRPTCM